LRHWGWYGIGKLRRDPRTARATPAIAPGQGAATAAERRRAVNLGGMCRNIRTLHNFEPPATESEIEAAALQYVRKISGFTKPSQANQAAFDEAVAAVAEVSERLLAQLTTAAPPKDREVEAAKARARSAQRYAA
jgi:hypothetical protein